jgi:hypothetical protein
MVPAAEILFLRCHGPPEGDRVLRTIECVRRHDDGGMWAR